MCILAMRHQVLCCVVSPGLAGGCWGWGGVFLFLCRLLAAMSPTLVSPSSIWHLCRSVSSVCFAACCPPSFPVSSCFWLVLFGCQTLYFQTCLKKMHWVTPVHFQAPRGLRLSCRPWPLSLQLIFAPRWPWFLGPVSVR